MNNANLWNAFFEEYYMTFIECFKLSYSELTPENRIDASWPAIQVGNIFKKKRGGDGGSSFKVKIRGNNNRIYD